MSRFDTFFCSPQTQQPKSYSSNVSYSTNIAISYFSRRKCRGKSRQPRSFIRGKSRQFLAKAHSNHYRKVVFSEKYARPRAQEVARFAGGCEIVKSPFSTRRKCRGKYRHLLAKDDSNLSRWSNAHSRYCGHDRAHCRKQHSK